MINKVCIVEFEVEGLFVFVGICVLEMVKVNGFWILFDGLEVGIEFEEFIVVFDVVFVVCEGWDVFLVLVKKFGFMYIVMVKWLEIWIVCIVKIVVDVVEGK